MEEHAKKKNREAFGAFQTYSGFKQFAVSSQGVRLSGPITENERRVLFFFFLELVFCERVLNEKHLLCVAGYNSI